MSAPTSPMIRRSSATGGAASSTTSRVKNPAREDRVSPDRREELRAQRREHRMIAGEQPLEHGCLERGERRGHGSSTDSTAVSIANVRTVT
jgi:hypothetical protein